MSTFDPNGMPQQPQQPQQPQYGQPQQPQFQAQQQPQQFQQQIPNQFQQQPVAQRNSLATTAFVLAAISLVVQHVVSPLLMQLFYRSFAATYTPLSMFMFTWGPLIIGLPLLLVALGLGIAAVRPNRPAQGKTLAYVVIGATGFSIVGVILSMITGGFLRGFAY